MRTKSIQTIVILLALCLSGLSIAQQYPAKPIRIIVGLAAGGGNDILARIVGEKLSESLGQPVLVENRLGGSGNIAADYVSKSPPDGYTLLMTPTGNMVFSNLISTKLPYNPKRDFRAISMVAKFPLILVTSNSQSINNAQELIKFIQKNADKSNFGVSGTAFHFAAELFKIKTNTNSVSVPYKGSNEVMTGLIAGDILFSLTDTGPTLNHIQSGRIKALAVTSTQRLNMLPNVPTMKEAGIQDMEIELWSGLFAPAATPELIVQKLSTEVAKIVHANDVSERFKGMLLTPVGNSSEEFTSIVNTDISRWAAVAKAANIQPLD
jgi:tripartite-type tricarboxylate transporter receptor subunit TctC